MVYFLAVQCKKKLSQSFFSRRNISFLYEIGYDESSSDLLHVLTKTTVFIRQTPGMLQNFPNLNTLIANRVAKNDSDSITLLENML